MEKQLTSIYDGTVIHSYDPEFRGRVKVFIPMLHIPLLQEIRQNFTQTNSTKQGDIFINSVGEWNGENFGLSNIEIKELVKHIPYSEIMFPIFGGESATLTHMPTNKTSTSQAKFWPSTTDDLGIQYGAINNLPISVDPAFNTPELPSQNNTIQADDLYAHVRHLVEKSSLPNTVPRDGAKYGIETGSVDEWTRFIVGLASIESGGANSNAIRTNATGDRKFGNQFSRGVFQLSPRDGKGAPHNLGREFTDQELYDPKENVRRGFNTIESLVTRYGIIAERNPNPSNNFDTYFGVARYFGPLRRANDNPSSSENPLVRFNTLPLDLPTIEERNQLEENNSTQNLNELEFVKTTESNPQTDLPVISANEDGDEFIIPNETLFPDDDELSTATNPIAENEEPDSSDSGATWFHSVPLGEDATFNNIGPDSNIIHSDSFTDWVPTEYAGAPSGVTSTITVGARVWIQFVNHDPNYPIVVGSMRTQKDYKNVNKTSSPAPDMPTENDMNNSFEPEQPNEEDYMYRQQTLLNQRGGFLEIISTTDRERLRIGNHNGNSLTMSNNDGMSLFTHGPYRKHIRGNVFSDIKGHNSTFSKGDKDDIIFGDRIVKIGDVKNWKPNFESIKKNLQSVHDKKRLFDLRRTQFINSLDQSTLQSLNGSFADCPVCGGLNVNCRTCAGTGLSPSSQDGKFTIDPLKSSLQNDIINTNKENLSELENLNDPVYPSGGSEIYYVSKNKIHVVGLEMNDLQPFRKDPLGKLVPYGIQIVSEGVSDDLKASPLIEDVHVEDLPGGDYTEIVGNKYNLIVGANGIKMNTYGNMSLGANSRLNMVAEEINIDAKTESIITAERIELIGNSIALRSKPSDRGNGIEEQNIFIEGNCNIGNNLKIRGGAHIEGELSVQHITGPVEIHRGDLLPGFVIGVTSSGDIVTSLASPNCMQFLSLPMNLFPTKESVRTNAATMNDPSPVQAHPVLNQSEAVSVLNKFPSGTQTTETLEKPEGNGDWSKTTDWDQLNEIEESVEKELDKIYEETTGEEIKRNE